MKMEMITKKICREVEANVFVLDIWCFSWISGKHSFKNPKLYENLIQYKYYIHYKKYNRHAAYCQDIRMP